MKWNRLSTSHITRPAPLVVVMTNSILTVVIEAVAVAVAVAVAAAVAVAVAVTAAACPNIL